ncbi:aldo/keto reductase [Streptomyces cyaneofuscatus]|uniref:aldo/keto reductase n=1 Tax=Streptomyces cyaneofuscatus TaxID=66883 RepID=UPI00365C4A51
MLRRRIGGPTGPLASALSLGTLPFGTTVDKETSFAALDRFVEAGGTLLDTADNYAFWRPAGPGTRARPPSAGGWPPGAGPCATRC